MKRKTIQSALVMETVGKMNCHPTADEIYETIARDYPTLSRATVYRNLRLMSESGELRKVEIPDGPDRFDCRTADHYHAKCVRCGRVFDVEMPYLADLEKKIANPQGFEFHGHDLIFKCVCPQCRLPADGRAPDLKHPNGR